MDTARPSVLLLLLALGPVHASGEGARLGLLTPGTFHGDEVDARSGEEWLALVAAGTGFELRRCRIVVKVVNDPIVDEEGQATGKEVSGCGEALVLLATRGASALKAGGVPAVPSPDEDLPVGGAVPLQGEPFAPLRLTLPRDGDGCRVVVERGETRQVLETGYRCGELVESEAGKVWQPNETLPRVLWAGDLDRDGQLDVLAQLSDHYNVSRVCLFLSSLAKPGEILGLAAEHLTVGC